MAAELPSSLAATGWDNQLWHLGDTLAVRVNRAIAPPSHAAGTQPRRRPISCERYTVPRPDAPVNPRRDAGLEALTDEFDQRCRSSHATVLPPPFTGSGTRPFRRPVAGRTDLVRRRARGARSGASVSAHADLMGLLTVGA
jgi:hypothetical protein